MLLLCRKICTPQGVGFLHASLAGEGHFRGLFDVLNEWCFLDKGITNKETRGGKLSGSKNSLVVPGYLILLSPWKVWMGAADETGAK